MPKRDLDFHHLELGLNLEISKILKQFHGVIASCSGGLDSTALFYFLCHLHKEKKIRLHGVLHFNFGLRGAESDGDERFVEAFATAGGIPFMKQSAILSPGPAVQERARTARQAVYREYIRAGYCVALGHTANDMAETFLFRLARGSSVGKAAGMHRLRQGFWRPLLGLERKVLTAWAEREHIAFRDDSSNEKTAYTRNFIRHNVLHPLDDRLPGSSARLADAALEAQAIADYVAKRESTRIAQCLSQEGLAAASLQKLPKAVAFLVLGEVARKLSGKVNAIRNRAWLEDVWNALTTPRTEPRYFSIEAGARLRVEGTRLFAETAPTPSKNSRSSQYRQALEPVDPIVRLGPGASGGLLPP